MNRYKPPSKATPTTRCQKCLKYGAKTPSSGHYSYECSASTQQRPYVSRPSRTQQLLNPKLAPTLTSDVPNDLLRKYVALIPVGRKGVADELLAKAEQDRGRKRQRMDSASRSSSEGSSVTSISSISTNKSASPVPKRDRHHQDERRRKSEKWRGARRRSPSVSSDQASASEQDDGRRTRRRIGSRSPSHRGRKRASRSPSSALDNRAISRSPELASGSTRNKQSTRRPDSRHERRSSPKGLPKRPHRSERVPDEPHKDRTRGLSPYSRRLELTQAMNL